MPRTQSDPDWSSISLMISSYSQFGGVTDVLPFKEIPIKAGHMEFLAVPAVFT